MSIVLWNDCFVIYANMQQTEYKTAVIAIKIIENTAFCFHFKSDWLKNG